MNASIKPTTSRQNTFFVVGSKPNPVNEDKSNPRNLNENKPAVQIAQALPTDEPEPQFQTPFESVPTETTQSPLTDNASTLGEPISNSNSGNVIIRGNNNGAINTGVINLDPTSRRNKNTTSWSANIKIRFDNQGLKYAGIRLNYARYSTRNESNSLNNQTNNNNLTLGFEIDYTRTDVSEKRRLQGVDDKGELMRAEEGGNIMRFEFENPFPGHAEILDMVVAKGEKEAVAKVKLPDGRIVMSRARRVKN